MFRRPSHLRLQKPNKAPAKCATAVDCTLQISQDAPKTLKTTQTTIRKTTNEKRLAGETRARAQNSTPHLNNCTLLQLRKTRITTLMFLKSCHKCHK
ncbi:hypothetical protein TNCV_4287031 [Trichonephila clavipes]|nr:hypothetical protein TNCV_4287031 [Trichonephila clavipes]